MRGPVFPQDSAGLRRGGAVCQHDSQEFPARRRPVAEEQGCVAPAADEKIIGIGNAGGKGTVSAIRRHPHQRKTKIGIKPRPIPGIQMQGVTMEDFDAAVRPETFSGAAPANESRRADGRVAPCTEHPQIPVTGQDLVLAIDKAALHIVA